MIIFSIIVIIISISISITDDSNNDNDDNVNNNNIIIICIIIIIIIIIIVIIISSTRGTADLRTTVLDFGGFGSSRILLWGVEFSCPWGIFPEVLSQQVFSGGLFFSQTPLAPSEEWAVLFIPMRLPTKVL